MRGEGELIAKKRAQFGLQSATRLHEAGIASNGATNPPGSTRRRPGRPLLCGAVNTFPGLVRTARHITKVGCTRSRQANRKEASVQGMAHDWGEVVTR